MLELASGYAKQRRELATALLGDLGREPTARDRVAAVNLASLHVTAERVEKSGRNASALRQQITQAMRAWRPETKPAKSAADFMAEMQAAARPKKDSAA